MKILALLRANQYVKNLIIFFPLFIDGRISSYHDLLSPSLIFAGFCLISSSVYIFNDIRDAASDREHPVKKRRPIASGSVSIATARWWWAGLMVSGFLIIALASTYGAKLAVVYVLINIAYSTGLKFIPVADLAIIASGYIIRLLAGAEVADVPLTSWIMVLTVLLAAFLTLCKRRYDLNLMQKIKRHEAPYSLKALKILIPVFVLLNIGIYTLWSFQPDTHARLGSSLIKFSSVFVMAGFLRFLWRLYRTNRTSDPIQAVLEDRVLQVTLVTWSLFLAWIVYS